jgi:hypothetical protein
MFFLSKIDLFFLISGHFGMRKCLDLKMLHPPPQG